MRRRRNSRFLLVATICGLCAADLRAQAKLPPYPSDFYVVSVGFSDYSPAWHRSVLEVRPQDDSVLVQYIQVLSANGLCSKPTKILATAARLPNTSLAAITGSVNLCAMDQSSLNRNMRAFPETRKLFPFAGDSFAIVATCGTDTRVIRLPEEWTVDMTRLKRKRPRVAALWMLERAVITRAFRPSPFTIAKEMATRLQPATEAVLAELKSGRFDAGLQAIAPGSFEDDVAALSSVVKFTVTVANADHVGFGKYVEPEYPTVAKQELISGNVELELTFNRITGETEQVTVISGDPVLALAGKASAQQWRFMPGAETALHATRVRLDFDFRCP